MKNRAEEIAAAILTSHSSAYHALEPTQHVARRKVIEQAARAVQPLLDAALREHAEAFCTGNPT